VHALSCLAALAAALFAGAALYVTLVEHPARLACGPPMALAEFRTSYPRAARVQAPLAIVACLAGAGVWLTGGAWGWLVAGVTIGLVVPFTVVVIMPTNRRLQDPALDPDVPEVRALLRRWGLLHLVRTALGLGAAGWMLRLLAAG
jgi:hypothetical protein